MIPISSLPWKHGWLILIVRAAKIMNLSYTHAILREKNHNIIYDQYPVEKIRNQIQISL